MVLLAVLADVLSELVLAGLLVSGFAALSEGVEAAGPLVEDVDDRESVIYQPLPLNTMPTGWITLRNEPPHCSQVVSGASVKLCRFSITSLQAVQV